MMSDELKKLRVDLGLNQKEFAALIGISSSHLCNLENEVFRIPSHIEARATSSARYFKALESKDQQAAASDGAVMEAKKLEEKKVVVAGVDPDQPIVTNAQGGMQSHVSYRFDLMHAGAMFEMAKVLEYGARRYDAWNWLKIPIEDHLNHLIIHAYAYLAGDRSDDHLSHIMCRAMFAQGVEIEESKPREG